MGLILNRRREMGGKSLPYDAEIEYLESTGTQWIDTGIDGNSVYGIHFYFIPTGYTSEWASIISGALDNFTIGYNDRNTNRCYIRYRTAELVNSLYISTSDWNYLKLVNNVISLAGASYNVSTPVSTASGNIVIGNNSTYSRPSKIRIKSLQLYNTSSGNIVRDMIPVRVGNVGYLYDKVSGELFGNSGTGDFVLGPDV